jgi:Xaa-Pro aminopeptidase
MRVIKSDEEVELLQRSARLADRGFDHVVEGLKPGMTEFEVLASLEKAMRDAGGDDFFNLIFSVTF